MHVLLFRTFAVLYFLFFQSFVSHVSCCALFYLILILLCTFSFHVALYLWSWALRSPIHQHILSPSVCTLFRIFTSVVLHFWIDSYIPRSLLCFPFSMFPRRAYLCSISQCFVFLLFRTFIDLYIRCFVLSLFRSISISLFHTPVVSHFMVSSISHRSFVRDTYTPQCYVSRSLCSPVSMFPDPYVPRSYVPRYLDFTVICSPVSMFPSIYVPRSLCSPILSFHCPMFSGPYVSLYLCSPILRFHCPMFPMFSMFPSTYVPRSLCSPVLCSMFSGLCVPQYLCSPGTYISQWYLLSSFHTFINFVVSNFCYSLFCTFFV